MFEEIEGNLFCGRWILAANISTALLVTNIASLSIIQLKECLKQCDKFYAEVMFNLSLKNSTK